MEMTALCETFRAHAREREHCLMDPIRLRIASKEKEAPMIQDSGIRPFVSFFHEFQERQHLAYRMMYQYTRMHSCTGMHLI